MNWRSPHVYPKDDLGVSDAQLCFTHLQNLGSSNTYTLAHSNLSLWAMRITQPVVVLTSACNYLQQFYGIAPVHRMRINELLPSFIKSASKISGNLAMNLLHLAMEDIDKKTDLQNLYNDAAGAIVEALWSYIPAEVLTKLLETFQGQLLSDRSSWKVLRTLASKELLEEDSSKAEEWRSKLKRLGARSLHYHRAKELSGILHQVFREEGKTSRDSALPKLFLYQYYGAILHASGDHALVEESLNNLLQSLLTKPSDKEGILSAIGLIAARHMESVLKVLKNYASEEVLSAEPHQDNIQNILVESIEKIVSTERYGSLFQVRPFKNMNEEHQS